EFYVDENNIDDKEVRIRNNPGSELARTRSSLEKRVSNKIISYVLVFIMQVDSAWIYVVCVIGIHFGGVGNAIQYIVNEGWHPRNVDPNVSWSFVESPSRFVKRLYPNSQNMHAPSSISSLPSSSRPPSSSTVSISHKTFDKHGTTNSIGSDVLSNTISSNNSVKDLNNNPYNIEINIDINNFVTESEMALSKVKIKEKYGDDIDLDYMLSLVNAARSDNGVEPPLQLNSLLVGTAQYHSEWMDENNDLSHDDDEGDFATRISNTGYDWNFLGENIAEGYTDEDSVMDGWMNSEPHRENILSPDFRDFGAGRSGNYWTQDFGCTFEESDS
ncbi:4475_t:CDS:2, partial [Dentiscutata erythropus]